MSKKSQNYALQRSENIKVLIADIKIRQNLRDVDIANKLELPLSTFRAKKRIPSEFRMDEIWGLMLLGNVEPERKQELL